MLRKLSFISALVIACAIATAECCEPTSQDTPARPSTQTIGDPSKPDPDEPKLIPTDDPNVFKVTKPLPRPAEAANYPKPEYPQLGYKSSFEGAEKVAIYLEDLLVYSFSTGDYKDFKSVCSNASSWCTKAIGLIEDNNQSNSWRFYKEHSKVKVTGYGIPPKENNKGEISIRIETTLSDRELFNGKKLTKTIRSETKLRRYVNLSYWDGRWVVVSLDSEEIK